MLTEYVLMSIKPHFAEEILSGKKKFELRARVAPLNSGDLVIIYASSPVKSIIGVFRAGKIFIGNYEEIINILRNYPKAGITEEDLKYIANRKRKVMAVEVLAPRRLSRPVALSEIRKLIPGFRPPVSYMKLKPSNPIIELVMKLLKSLGDYL